MALEADVTTSASMPTLPVGKTPKSHKLNIYVTPTQYVSIKSGASFASLSVSGYVRLCVELPDDELEAIASTTAFKLAIESGYTKRNQKSIQTKMCEETAERLQRIAKAKGLSLSSLVKGLVMSQQVEIDSDGTCATERFIDDDRKLLIVKRALSPDAAKAIDESMTKAASQVRRLGYLVDNCLYALNTIKKRRNLKEAKILSLLETNEARLQRVGEFQKDIKDAMDEVTVTVEEKLGSF